MDKKTSAPSVARRKNTARRRRKKSRFRLIHMLCAGTKRLYTAIGRSGAGRALTAYRRIDGAVGGGRQNRFGPISRGRMPVAEAVKQSRIIAVMRGFWSLMYDLPMKFYGLVALLYGAVGSVLYCLVPLVAPWFSVDPFYLIVSLVMMLLSLAPIASHSTLRQSVSRSSFAALVFSRWLCVPLDAPPASDQKHTIGASLTAVILAFVTAIAALFIHSFLVPVIVLCIILLGLIFSSPEAGVLLSSFFLPVAWVLPEALTPLAGLLVLTWVSYGVKLICLHRVIRFDISDIAGFVLLVLCLISCTGGIITGSGRVMPSILLTVCLSAYFLFAHLVTTRAYMARCLGGIGAGVVLTAVVACFSRADTTAADWLSGSRGGDLIGELFAYARGLATGVNGYVLNLLLLVGTVFLCMALVRARRLFSRAVIFALLALTVYLAILSGSVSLGVCLVCVLVLFFLLLDHRSLVAGALLLPGTVGAAGWYFAWRGQPTASAMRALSDALCVKEERYTALWRVAAEKPFGHGAGFDCLGGNLPLEVLISLGFPGLAAALITLCLLLLKSLTALTHTATFADRATVVGLLSGTVGALMWGMTHGYWLTFPAILVPVIFCALGSAFANILFDETDARAATAMNTPREADRLYRQI